MIFLEIWVSEANFSRIFLSLKTETFSRKVDNINKKQHWQYEPIIMLCLAVINKSICTHQKKIDREGPYLLCLETGVKTGICWPPGCLVDNIPKLIKLPVLASRHQKYKFWQFSLFIPIYITILCILFYLLSLYLYLVQVVAKIV